MEKAIADTLHYISERTVEMDETHYAQYLDRLKDEITRLQFISEWQEPEE